MRNISITYFGFFLFFAISAMAMAIYQVFISASRELTPLEGSLMSLLLLSFSTISGWFFSKIYSQSSDKETVIKELIKMLEGSEIIGLDSIESQRKKSNITAEMLKEVHQSFLYIGISGAKLIPQMFAEKSEMREFIAKNYKQSNFRMMFMDPDGETFKNWGPKGGESAPKLREDARKSLRILAKQIQNGCKIQIKLYDYHPPLRIVITNEQKAYIRAQSYTNDGLDLPQLCFVDKGDKSILPSLVHLYDTFWKSAKDFDYTKYL